MKDDENANLKKQTKKVHSFLRFLGFNILKNLKQKQKKKIFLLLRLVSGTYNEKLTGSIRVAQKELMVTLFQGQQCL